jgi:hypothetical protein
MARLQEDSKATLVEMLDGKDVTWSDNLRCAVESWANMSTMVFEHAEPRLTTTPLDQRYSFRETMTPPPGWMVWTGKYAGGQWDGRTWRRTLGLTSGEGIEARNPKCNTQFTTFVLGKLMLHTFHTTSWLDINPINYAGRFGIRAIWPIASPAIQHLRVLSDADIDRVASEAVDELKDQFGLRYPGG